MAKRDVIDPETLTGDSLVKHLVNKVELFADDTVKTVRNMQAEIIDAMGTKLKPITPICEQFPTLCKTVNELKESQSAAVQTKPKRVHEVADSLAIHYQECNDPECRRSIRARLAAVGLATPPEDEPHVEHKEAEKTEVPATAEVKAETPAQQPWEKLGVAESNYKKHKSYYDSILANGG